jgi:hypothetical protein
MLKELYRRYVGYTSSGTYGSIAITWITRILLGGSVASIAAFLIGCATSYNPFAISERVRGQLTDLSQQTGTWNHQPHGGDDEKSNSAPCSCPK